MRRSVAALTVILVSVIARPANADSRDHARVGGWTLLATGALVFAGGVIARHPGGEWTLPSTILAGSGAICVGGGVALLWKSHRETVFSHRLAPPGLDLVAGRDPKRGSDLGLRIPVWRTTF